RHLARSGQQEGEATRYAFLDDTELPVVELDVATDLGQIAAHQREMVLVVNLPQGTDTLDRRHVVEAAAQRIAGVRGIGDHATGAQDGSGLAHESRLRILGMDGEVLSQTERARGALAFAI